MRGKWWLVLVCAVLSCGVAAKGDVIASTFDKSSEGMDGWTAEGATTAGGFGWHSTGGNPGAYINADDNRSGHWWYFVAPAKFLGDQSVMFGGVLAFDLKAWNLPGQHNPNLDVVLSNGADQIGLSLTKPGTAWTSYSLRLDSTAGWFWHSSPSGTATNGQIKSILANVTALKILGDWDNSYDTTGLDDVVLRSPSAVPLPAALPAGLGLMIILAGTGYARQRRRL